ncbi:hypothetical protein L1887_24884 [Cichorium endivia]|nr:hypothetical protein L1887_24884 [Cichorium endivia]
MFTVLWGNNISTNDGLHKAESSLAASGQSQLTTEAQNGATDSPKNAPNSPTQVENISPSRVSNSPAQAETESDSNSTPVPVHA